MSDLTTYRYGDQCTAHESERCVGQGHEPRCIAACLDGDDYGCTYELIEDGRLQAIADAWANTSSAVREHLKDSPELYDALGGTD